MTTIMLDIAFALIPLIIVFFLMYRESRKKNKLVDLSVVIAAFYYGTIGYEIASENRSNEEIITLFIILGILYFLSWWVIQFWIAKHNSKSAQN